MEQLGPCKGSTRRRCQGGVTRTAERQHPATWASPEWRFTFRCARNVVARFRSVARPSGIATTAPPTAVVRCAHDHRLPVVGLGEQGKTVVA